MIQIACPGFSPYPRPFFPSHQGGPKVAAAEVSDARHVPKSHRSPCKVTWRATSHRSHSCCILFLLSQHGAVRRASTWRQTFCYCQCCCIMFWIPQCAKSDWALYRFMETCSCCVGTPIRHDLGDGCSSWFCAHPHAQAQSRTSSWGRAGVRSPPRPPNSSVAVIVPVHGTPFFGFALSQWTPCSVT